MSKYKVISIKNTEDTLGYDYDGMVDIGDIIEGNLATYTSQRIQVVRYKGYSYHIDDLELISEFSLKDIYDL